jgi:TonB family protein
LRPVKIALSIAFLLVAGAHPASQGQSGRVKSSSNTPAVAIVPINASKLSTPSLSKEWTRPKLVDGERIYLSPEVDTKAFIWKKPQPVATKEARREIFFGKIVLEGILAADGQVTHLTILKGLHPGLNQKTLEAAQQIRFEPAMKDHKPVSMWIELVYEFWFF